MKIEMGESLFYSWLRHVKECHIVQTNWKVSPQWNLQNEEELEHLYNLFASVFTAGEGIFKKNSSLQQFLKQAECDVLGISIQGGTLEYHAVDVAFHENGLSYGDKETTALKVAEKCIRTALCLFGYMNTTRAEIVFASPKIHTAPLELIEPYIKTINRIFFEEGYDFHVRLICNDEFQKTVLDPILLVSENIADTSELFLRGFQMYSMFAEKDSSVKSRTSKKSVLRNAAISNTDDTKIAFRELKIGQLANTVLRNILQSGSVSEKEIGLLQQKDYCKQVFDIQYPLLAHAKTAFARVRYYSAPLFINGSEYYLCSQWFETPQNNDRPCLEKWIADHQ